MKVENAIISILMFSLSLYAAFAFDDLFASVIFWLLGILICISGLIFGERK